MEGCEQSRSCVAEPGEAQGGVFVSTLSQAVSVALTFLSCYFYGCTQGIEVLEGALNQNPFEIVTTEPFLFNICKLSSSATCLQFLSRFFLLSSFPACLRGVVN